MNLSLAITPQGTVQRLEGRVGVQAIDRVQGIVGVELVDGVEGVVGIQPIERIRRVAGVQAVDRVEGILGIHGVDRVQGIIRPELVDGIEDVVVALVLLVEAELSKRDRPTEEQHTDGEQGQHEAPHEDFSISSDTHILLPAALGLTAQRAQVVKVRFVFEAEDVEDDFVVETEMYDCKT